MSKNATNVAENSPLIKAIATLVHQHGLGKVSNMVSVSKHLLRQILNGGTVIRCKNTHLCSALDDLILMREELVDMVNEKDNQSASVTEIMIKHILD